MFHVVDSLNVSQTEQQQQQKSKHIFISAFVLI